MANRLGQIMQQRRLTYQQLGKLVSAIRGKGLSESTITKIVRYDHEPTTETKAAIASALDMQATEIWPNEIGKPIDKE